MQEHSSDKQEQGEAMQCVLFRCNCFVIVFGNQPTSVHNNSVPVCFGNTFMSPASAVLDPACHDVTIHIVHVVKHSTLWPMASCMFTL